MKLKKRITVLIMALLLICLPFAVTAASAGTAQNPLITLDYVNNVLIPKIKSETAAELKEELYEQFKAECYEQLKEEILCEVQGMDVEQIKNEILAEIEDELVARIKAETYTQLKDQLYDELYAQIITGISGDLANEVADQLGGSLIAYQAVFVPKGQKLQAKAGMDKSCEFILSSGDAVCYVNDPADVNSRVGLRDCTSGLEILNGQACPPKHYVVIPRGNGRGVKVTSVQGAWFLVRGDYEIV